MKNFIKKVLKILGLWGFIESSYPEKIIDPRRFWRGKPFLSLEPNLPFFTNLKKQIFVLTFNQESRNCVYLEPQEKIILNLTQADLHLVLYLSFASEAEPSLDQRVKVFLNQKQSTELRYLVKNKWHSVCLAVDQQNSVLEIINESQNKIALAYPVLKPKYESGGIKNIIVIVLDSLARQAFDDKFTPNINRFFQNGISYSNCFGQSEWSLPSAYSLFLSRYPLDHGICELKPDVSGLDPNKDKTFIELLRNNGFLTSAYSTSKVFHPGFDKYLMGFDRFFYDPFPHPETTHLAICQKAIEHLRGFEQNKNFLFLHFLDTHEPWANPSEAEEVMLPAFRVTDPHKEYEFLKRGAGDTKSEPIFEQGGIDILKKRNQARLGAVDLSLQFLFDYLEKTGKQKETAVVLTSDHGYPYLGSKQPLLCNSRVNTVLLLSHPSIQVKVIDDLVALNLDLGPALLKIAGVEESRLVGDGLAIPPFGGAKRDYVISESIFGDLYKASVRDKEYVYHFICSFDQKTRKVQPDQVKNQMLFLRSNETECLDLSLRFPERFQSLRKILESHLKRFNNGRGKNKL